MSSWLWWLSAELDASVIALALIAAARVFPRIPAAWRVGLLTIALIKLAVPILPLPTLVALPGLRSLEIAPTAAPNVSALWVVYALVTIALLAVLCRRVVAVKSMIREPGTSPPQALEQRFHRLATRLGVGRCTLRISHADDGPLACGFLEPIVVIPSRFVAGLTHDQLDAVLLHELAHHARRDLWLRLVALVVASVWWFNPVVWLLVRELRRTTEEAADDTAVGHLDRDVPRYCEALVRSARFGAYAVGSPVAGLHPLGHRLLRLATRGATAPTLGIGGWVLCAAVGLLAMSTQTVRVRTARVDDDQIVIRDRIVFRASPIAERDLAHPRIRIR